MDFIKNIFRISVAWFTFPIAAWNGSRKSNKWIKKNKKNQDPSLHPFDERYEYIRTKAKGILRRAGITVEVEGQDNIPRGGSWIVPNHSSNLDGIYLLKSIGSKSNLMPVAKEEIKKSKMFKGYFYGADAIFLDRDSLRQNLTILEGATQYAKNHNRGLVIFPEGTRSFSTELLDFKNGLFKFPQKYFLPIVPVTITGTLQAKRFWWLKTRTVKVIIHKPIKAIEHSKLPTNILGDRVKNIIQKELTKYEKQLSKKELEVFESLREKGRKQNKNKKETKEAK